jgi:hypothetical protein
MKQDKEIFEYVKDRIDESFSTLFAKRFDLSESEEEYQQEEEPDIAIIFKRTIKYTAAMLVGDVLKSVLKTYPTKFSIGNMTDLGKVLKKIRDTVELKRKTTLGISAKDVQKVYIIAKIANPKQLGDALGGEADYLKAHGVDLSKIEEGRKRDKHRLHGENLYKTSDRYSHGEEIDLGYQGDGHEGYEHNVVMRTQDGQGPLMVIGYNGMSADVMSDLRSIYAYQTGCNYWYCSGISLKKWKVADHDKKISCARDTSKITRT